MRIAVALFGLEVSPRWCVAHEALLVTVRDGVSSGREVLALGDCSNAFRLGRLHARAVNVLVCGGFDRRFMPLARRLGIRVVCGVSGSAEEALRTFAAATNAASQRAEGSRSSTGTITEITKERT